MIAGLCAIGFFCIGLSIYLIIRYIDENILLWLNKEEVKKEMKLRQFAEMLDGKEYGYPQFAKEEIQIAKENGFVIVYGVSYDLMEFEGAIYDEGSCFNGGKIYICETGCVDYGNARTKCIEAKWCNTDEYGNVIKWTYKTDIPHETFMIYENGEKYCQGIVFEINALS